MIRFIFVSFSFSWSSRFSSLFISRVGPFTSVSLTYIGFQYTSTCIPPLFALVLTYVCDVRTYTSAMHTQYTLVFVVDKPTSKYSTHTERHQFCVSSQAHAHTPYTQLSFRLIYNRYVHTNQSINKLCKYNCLSVMSSIIYHIHPLALS